MDYISQRGLTDLTSDSWENDYFYDSDAVPAQAGPGSEGENVETSSSGRSYPGVTTPKPKATLPAFVKCYTCHQAAELKGSDYEWLGQQGVNSLPTAPSVCPKCRSMWAP